MMRKLVRKYVLSLARLVGSRIHDYRTDECLGRALILVWRGRVHVIGYQGEKALVVDWLPEEKTRYWRSRIGFTTYRGEFDG